MPLPKDVDPYATWWTLKDPNSMLHGVMFMKKQNTNPNQKSKSSQVADEHLLTGLLNTGSFNLLDRLFSGEAHEPAHKRRKIDDFAPVKGALGHVEEEKSETPSAQDMMEVEKK
jgi:hypothetical protein